MKIRKYDLANSRQQLKYHFSTQPNRIVGVRLRKGHVFVEYEELAQKPGRQRFLMKTVGFGLAGVPDLIDRVLQIPGISNFHWDVEEVDMGFRYVIFWEEPVDDSMDVNSW
jgi:hypothetical protein